jgi:hypothetical protein
VEGAPSLTMPCVRRERASGRISIPEALPDRVADRAESVPADVLEEALDGLSPERIAAPGGLLTQPVRRDRDGAGRRAD